MPNHDTISQFMWGYQRHFLSAAGSAFESLCEEIGITVHPTIFMVGILEDKSQSSMHHVCVEPEDDFEYTQDDFSRWPRAYKNALAADPRSEIIHTLPVAQKNHLNQLHLKAMRSAVVSCVDREGVETFCSLAATVGGYSVHVVLQIPQEEFSSLTLLKTSERVSGPYHRYQISRSLIEAAVTIFLTECRRELWVPEPGSALSLGSSSAEMARQAGEAMMAAAASVGELGESLDTHTLFDACNRIAAWRYEGAESAGGLVLAKKGHPAVKATLTLRMPVSLRDHRGVRKLLELTGSGRVLLSDGNRIYGVGQTADGYDFAMENLFAVEFSGHYKWQLRHDDKALMDVAYGEPKFPGLPFDLRKLRRDLPRIFSSVSNECADRIADLVIAAAGQSHGTTVIITPNAESEAMRLSSQSTLVEPFLLTPDTMLAVSSIDGGVVIDPTGTCHAIGVILDGPATAKGNPTRGGRYNSAVRYIVSHPECMAVVVSSDGSVDVLPNLRPQVPRETVDLAIQAMEQLAGNRQVRPGSFSQVLSMLNALRFYLLPEDCKRLNPLIEEVKTKIVFEVGELMVGYPPFFPDPEMNTGYYE